jgi:hypothetical protein
MNSSRCLIVCLMMAVVSIPAFSQVSISVDIAPPPLVVEDQPACPDDGLVWTPGYWAYDDQQGAYYWVPGSWEQPPEVGLYWTPAYWGWNNGAYVFNEGYWGPSVGFYGGINYGHGYWGNGYGGGRWDNGHFAYNTAANNVQGGHVHNTYADRSVVRSGHNRVSFNGGQGGVNAQPTPQQQQVAQNRVQPTAQQQAHFQAASQTRSHQVKVNAHPVTANGAAPAANQPQVSQQPAAAPAQTHNDSGPLAGWNSQAQHPATSPAAPAVSNHDAAFTGGDAQAQHKEHATDKNVAPANPSPAAAVNNQPKPEEKPHDVADQAPVKHEAAPSEPTHEVKMDGQPHVVSQAAPAVSHDTHVAAPDVHPQAAAPHAAAPEVHAPAGAQPKPEAKAAGPAKQDGQPGGH